jgi:hypothetical protein
MNQSFFEAIYIDVEGHVGHADLKPPFRSLTTSDEDEAQDDGPDNPGGGHERPQDGTGGTLGDYTGDQSGQEPPRRP